jgi:hypothetical protein
MKSPPINSKLWRWCLTLCVALALAGGCKKKQAPQAEAVPAPQVFVLTDFGIKPPELTGVMPIKTGNQVKVTFEWLLALKP